jgi:C1A family cysteine protease
MYPCPLTLPPIAPPIASSFPLVNSRKSTLELPAKVDLRPKMPPVYDQLSLGSCSANAIVAAVEYDISGFNGSRLFVYYNEKLIENDISNDNGATIEDGIKSIIKYGVCEESYYPYSVENFKNRPSDEAYKNALLYRALNIKKLHNDINIYKNCLASGFPIITSIYVYKSFEGVTAAATGVIKMPLVGEKNMGGHAILICGYDDDTQCWIGRNSWGAKWGDKGYFYLPYIYLLDSSLASTGWSITSVGNSDRSIIENVKETPDEATEQQPMFMPMLPPIILVKPNHYRIYRYTAGGVYRKLY